MQVHTLSGLKLQYDLFLASKASFDTYIVSSHKKIVRVYSSTLDYLRKRLIDVLTKIQSKGLHVRGIRNSPRI